MEFYYTAEDGTEQGPFTERQMTDWIRAYQFSEDQKIRFDRNGKQYNTTLGRMRKKNGHCTPFIFAKCDRVDKEKELRKEIEEASRSTQEIASMMDELRKSIAKTSLSSRQLMERMQRKIDAAANGEMKEESSIAPAAPAPTKAPPPTKGAAANEPNNSKTPKRVLPLVDVSSLNKDEAEIGEDRESIKILRDFLDDVDLDAAQKNLKFPIGERCGGCGALTENNLRQWLCHITAKNHLEKFRQKGGRVTKQCLDWYSNQLEQFPKRRRKEKEVKKEKVKEAENEVEGKKKEVKEKENEESAVDGGTVDLEKKKLECYMGVIMLPLHVPLLHIDPADTTSISHLRGRQELNKMRDLLFSATDKYAAEKSVHLPRTSCEVCNEKFDFTPRVVPHFLSNTHIQKYLAKRGSFSQHDFDFWTEICKLFPEADKDTRDAKAVRAQLWEMGKILDVETCNDSYTIYEKEDRRKHIVDFIKSQSKEHQRPVVVYMRSEDAGQGMLEYLKEELPEKRVGWANTAAECEELEVIISDSSLLLTRPHAIAFPSAPLEWRHKAEYAQKICGEYVEANLIIALPEEWNELKRFNRRAIQLQPFTPPTATPTVTVPPKVAPMPPYTPVYPLYTPRVAPPVASVPPFMPQTTSTRSAPNPTVPPNQRRYDPNQSAQSPQSPGESKKPNCAMM